MDDLCGYWSKYPPTHVLVGTYLLKGSERPQLGVNSAVNKDMQAASMAAAIHSVGGSHRGKLPDYYRAN